MPWQSVLERVLEIVRRPLEQEEVRWAVIGSVASALQGCRLSPRDIDFLALEPEGVHRFAELMAGFVTPPGEGENPFTGLDWWSTAEDPVWVGLDPHGFAWHFGRWAVEGMRVEIAHIVAPEDFPTSADGAGIWEAGPEIWLYVRPALFAGYVVPVVPLEIQLQTNLQRGLEERVQEIVTIFRQDGYNRALLRRSLDQQHLGVLERLMPDE